MNLRTTILTVGTIILTFNLFSQNHHFGIKAGYTKSMPAAPDNQVNFSGNEITVSQGVKRFKGLDGFQIGIYSHIDIGYDFLHLDFSPQYSRYGFQDNQDFVFDYLDFDIGVSNFNAEMPSKFVFGIGITPSFILTSEQIEDINSFDLKVYLAFGYRIYKDFVLSTQLRYGVIEIIPDTGITNLQLSLNLNIPILKIKK
ncbi:hypothetical protein BWZ20_15050 [Winogradskyella sp. J14-2]|uniref:hypothetical protein n=1 Tax=Winogradskyella sp. J14-2 TaxID=1936080 RepID=UPI0009728AE3|nr:hypothetical protein [Winogradskyella sp. J14-2]APY09538.1 hypothetical protein BWZ20_15050 [Winogradskyella sp. J14-2]